MASGLERVAIRRMSVMSASQNRGASVPESVRLGLSADAKGASVTVNHHGELGEHAKEVLRLVINEVDFTDTTVAGSGLDAGITSGNQTQYRAHTRSEEHTSELQSRPHLVCRLLLEKKKKNINHLPTPTHTPAHSNDRKRSS